MSKPNDTSGRVELLAQQLEEKDAIINGISDVLMLLEAKTYKILEVNQAFLKSYGLNREEILGKRCYEVTHHLNTPCHHANSACPCPLESSVATGNFSYAEHIHQDHDGKTLYFEITTYPLKDADGQVSRIIHLSRDITMRKHLEEEVKKSENKYRFLFNYIPNPVFVLDVENLEIIDCNDRVTTVYGLDKEELIKTSFMNLFEEWERERYASELKTSNILNQVRQVNRNNQTFFVNIHVSTSEYLGRQVLLACTSDITERLIAEQQLIQASKMTTLGEMATGIAHELNQPLSVIKTASSFLTKKVNKKEEITGEILKTLVEEINNHVDRASKVINHIREFGRKPEVVKEKIQVNDIINRALDIFSRQLKLREIEVVKELQAGLPPVLADSNRLEQVFINLLINARDAIEEKWQQPDHKCKAKKIFLKTYSKNGIIVIEVRDTGIGIPQSILNKIFEPFYTTKEVGKGTGLGLSISYSIVQDYHGTIKAETEEGEGFNFIIKFPVPDWP